ncbi:glycosyltransferase family 25 protein [Rhizobium sp. SL86]|uniref:glycosyltransferase family 25 protein n=1 Tax=Rhizobium sp. SL86 TaxID=2995148 RepID=UPI002276D186|nr:glycosyltransferase family 25 protein [Rhizobium sp. SL86]MCY1668263.1 glycosyltransferase family 25 protein [Rhizobium sp. SL86]
MKVYVINLDRATQRMERMREILDAQRLDWVRLPAVDGRQLSQEEQARWSATREDGSLILTPGEIGVLLSHRRFWEMVVASGEPGAVVEDDIHLAPSAHEWLREADWLPHDADIVKFETTGKTIAVSRQIVSIGARRRLARLLSAHLGFAGYIITPLAATRLLHATRFVERAIDHVVFDPSSTIFHDCTIYQTIPALCIQDQFLPNSTLGLGGEIERAWKREKKKSLPQKMLRELHRLYGQTRFALAGSSINIFGSRKNVKLKFPA